MDRKDAIEVIKKNWPDSSFARLRNALETLIPELKESEDERIRKSLIKSYTNQHSSNFPTEDGFTREQILAWLKKQDQVKVSAIFQHENKICKENDDSLTREDDRIRKALSAYFDKFKPNDMWDEAISFGDIVAWLRKQDEHANFCNKIQIGDNVTRNEDGVLVNLSQLKRVAKRGEQNLANSAKTCKVMQVTVVVIPKFRVGDVIRPKGSAAEYAIESISGECYHGKGWGLPISCEDDYELVIHNPAWSEEDEEMCKDIIQFIEKRWTDNGKSHLIPWLKDIKDRVQHQIQWKPSEEQMDALYTYIYNPQYFNSPDPRMELVESVYKDLKKLREG